MITTPKLPTFLSGRATNAFVSGRATNTFVALSHVALSRVAIFALTAFIAEAAFSHPLPQESSKVATVDVPACYMQTTNGTILSLSKLCEKQPVDSGIRSAPTFPSPYDAAAIEKFDRELYGEGN